MVGMSKSFVGSSRTRTFGAEMRRRTRSRRLSSPPDSLPTLCPCMGRGKAKRSRNCSAETSTPSFSRIRSAAFRTKSSTSMFGSSTVAFWSK